jgi:hypothetical protein
MFLIHIFNYADLAKSSSYKIVQVFGSIFFSCEIWSKIKFKKVKCSFKVSIVRSVHISIFGLVGSQKYKRTIKKN